MNIAMRTNDVVRWFLSQESMSPKKLQKLLYYAYSWGLVFLNDERGSIENKLFDGKFEAWVHGPVMYDIWKEFKEYGFMDIPQNVGTVITLREDIEDILRQVYEAYGDFTGNQLEILTHSEEPWIEAREGSLPMDSSDNLIKDTTIYNYYVQKLGI